MSGDETRPATIWTVGHSTRPLEAFLALLGAFGIRAVADVRRFPGSRRHPQYGRDALAAALAAHGIAYRWIPALGGRRNPRPDSPNTGWRNPAFRGYADYTASAEFAAGLDELLALARGAPTAIMCAEAQWWRCHRSIIADVLRVRGIEVVHIADAKRCTVHPYTAPARIVDGRLSYAAEES
jgi:uncharacterized protein (DUF488 family)